MGVVLVVVALVRVVNVGVVLMLVALVLVVLVARLVPVVLVVVALVLVVLVAVVLVVVAFVLVVSHSATSLKSACWPICERLFDNRVHTTLADMLSFSKYLLRRGIRIPMIDMRFQVSTTLAGDRRPP